MTMASLVAVPTYAAEPETIAIEHNIEAAEATPVVEAAVRPEEVAETKSVFEEVVIPTGYREVENDPFISVTREGNAGISADELKTPEITPQVKDLIEALKNAKKSGGVSEQGKSEGT